MAFGLRSHRVLPRALRVWGLRSLDGDLIESYLVSSPSPLLLQHSQMPSTDTRGLPLLQDLRRDKMAEVARAVGVTADELCKRVEDLQRLH